MKRLLAALTFLVILSLAFGALPGPRGVFMPCSPGSAKAIEIGPVQMYIITPKPVITDGGGEAVPEVDEFFPDPTAIIPDIILEAVPFRATPTPKPVITDGGGEENVDRQTTATPTPRPRTTGGGQYMTSEGPLFLSFRAKLTDKMYMFTPMDLSIDGEYRFPLVGSSLQVVGEAKVTVQNGMTIVTYLVVNGVKVNEKDEFFTFFPDILSVPSVERSKLQQVKLKFGFPYSVESWLGSDPKVLLYINCPISYKTSLDGLQPFSFEDPAYIRRVIEFVTLMD